MKPPTFNTLLALTLAHTSLVKIVPNSTLPTRENAGLTVVSTPIVLAAEPCAQSVADPSTYAHIMRSWLYGVLAIQSHPDIYRDVDLEWGFCFMIWGWIATQGVDSSVMIRDSRWTGLWLRESLFVTMSTGQTGMCWLHKTRRICAMTAKHDAIEE